MVFRLPLRQTEGFLRSIVELLGLGLPIPDHTTLSRRLQKLGTLRLRRLGADEPIYLLIDSTGLRIHVGYLPKPRKRRVWRKLHLAVNADTGEILAEDLTNRRTADCARVPKLLDQIDGSLASVAADGAYDAGSVYDAVQGKGDGARVTVLIPPGRGTQPSSIRSLGRRVGISRALWTLASSDRRCRRAGGLCKNGVWDGILGGVNGDSGFPGAPAAGVGDSRDQSPQL